MLNGLKIVALDINFSIPNIFFVDPSFKLRVQTCAHMCTCVCVLVCLCMHVLAHLFVHVCMNASTHVLAYNIV